MKRKQYQYISICGILLTVIVLLVACAGSEVDDAPAAPTTPGATDVNDGSIRFNATVWQMMHAAPRRATTFDSQSDLQSLAHFYCAVYNAGTLTSYIAPDRVSYAASQWTFDSGKHYWPAEGSLDFFAYAPYGGVSYITDLTYAATPNLTFNCVSLPMTNAGQADLEEFIYDIKTGQNKADQGASGVTLSFQHPFTRIYLKWANYNHEAISNLTVKLKGIKNNGSFSHTGSPKWTTSGDATDFTTTTLDAHNAASPTAILMIPQNWAGEIEVVADWVDWGDVFTHTLTKRVPTNWQAGYSYTYTFTITPSELKVITDKFTEQW